MVVFFTTLGKAKTKPNPKTKTQTEPTKPKGQLYKAQFPKQS
jgi:hypothetical protein